MFGADPTPETTVVGPDGDPEFAVVAGIHGDEPSGVRAVLELANSDLDLRRPVKLVVANPPAVAAHRRFLDADMNRSFPGDPDADTREGRLAAGLLSATEGCLCLSLHATTSYDDPMALVSRHDRTAQSVLDDLPVGPVVETTGAVDTAFPNYGSVVSVEAGRQGTETATENAKHIVRAFLRRVDALPGTASSVDSTYYTLGDPVPKDPDATYELCVENFEPVAPGGVLARSDDGDIRAEESFVPVLMSAAGYEDVLGYRGTVAGETLAEARQTWGVEFGDGPA